MEKFRVLKDIIGYRGKVFNIREQNILLYENDLIIKRQVMDTSNSVTIAVMNENSEVLITKEFRSAVGKFTWALPAGRIDPEESSLTAAVRELAEETGILANEDSFKLLDSVNLSEGVMNENSSIYFVKLDKFNHKIVDKSFDSDEFIAEYKWVGLKEAYELTSSAASHIALNRIEINLLKEEV